MPYGLPLTEEYINDELSRRQKGYGRGKRMQIEKDRAEILSGVYEGVTIGSPISLLIENRDWKSEREITSPSNPRPGHADLAGAIKYGLLNLRPIMERASARETAARVAAGAVAKKFLSEFDIQIRSHILAIGGTQVEANEGEKEISLVDKARKEGDTLGGVFEVWALGVPPGLGSHVHWDRKLNGRIAQAIMSINAVKGVEIGDGFSLAKLKGSEAHDIIEPTEDVPFFKHVTNHAGGIEGGMSNGESIVVRAAVKPVPTLGKPLPSIDLQTGERALAHFERSDVCVIPAAAVIGEAMLALVLADAMLEKFGGDNLRETKHNYQSYLQGISEGRK
jgi:chorismate synthase